MCDRRQEVQQSGNRNTARLRRGLARELELNRDELIFLAGRIPTKDLKLLQQYHETMPIIFQTLRKNPQAFEQFFAKN